MRACPQTPLGISRLRRCFDSVDGRTPPRWSSTSLISFPDCSGSFRRSCIINTNCFDGFQQARCQSSWRMISCRTGGGLNPSCSSIIFKFVKLFFLLQIFTIWVRVRFKGGVRDYLQLFKILKSKI